MNWDDDGDQEVFVEYFVLGGNDDRWMRFADLLEEISALRQRVAELERLAEHPPACTCLRCSG